MKRNHVYRSLAWALALFLLLQQEIPGLSAQEVRSYRAAEMMEKGTTGEERLTFLLIGQDHREGMPGKRSDSMILCSFFPENKKLVLTSVLRDLYVKIPGYGYERINAAYAIGGPALLKAAIWENFSIPIDGYVQADFSQFAGIINTLGGVTLELRADEAREINRAVKGKTAEEGLQTLDGDQTLAFARIRKLDRDADFSRTERQRRILKSLTEQYQDLSFLELSRLLRKILPAVETDMNPFTLLTYGKLVLPMLKNLTVESRRIPGEGAAVDRQIRGMSVLVPSLETIRQQNQDLTD